MINESIESQKAAADDLGNRLQLFFRQARPAILAQLLMGLFLLYIVWNSLEATVLPHTGLWFGILLAASALRLWLIARHRSVITSCSVEALQRLESWHTRLTGLSGLTWGLVPWFAWRGDQAALDYLAASMVFGMAGSATATLAALPMAFAWFVWPAVVPYIIKALMLGGAVYTVAAIIMLFGIVALSFFNRTVHMLISDSIRLRRENIDLIEQLREEKAAVEEASRIKSLFLAGVSHDLKHPLNALGLYLGYIKAQPQGLEQALPGMERALGGMGGQITRLLELSRLESGAIEVNPSKTDISALLATACDTVELAAAKKSLRLRTWIAEGCEVITDARLLQSIIDNLLSNAVRYTECGGILVALRRTKNGWRIEVWDTGPGVPTDRLPLLFDAYRRFDDRSHSSEKGYGLGLALVRKQCDLLGYRISAASRVGKGSVFRIHLAG